MSQDDQRVQFPQGISFQDIIGIGITACVARFDAVIKFSRPSELPLMRREKSIYERLGDESLGGVHEGILQYYGCLGDSILLQYSRYGSIRQYYANQASPIPVSLQLRWVKQIAAAVAFVHSRGILHGDVSCNNILLDEELNIKLCDFAGSSIDDSEALICYETSHEHPEIIGPSVRSELFALGSTFYEVMTRSKPYKERSDKEIVCAYRQGDYPSLASLPAFDDIILKCWTQGYASADKLLEDITVEITAKSKTARSSPLSTLCHITIVPLAVTLLALPLVLFWARARRSI